MSLFSSIGRALAGLALGFLALLGLPQHTARPVVQPVSQNATASSTAAVSISTPPAKKSSTVTPNIPAAVHKAPSASKPAPPPLVQTTPTPAQPNPPTISAQPIEDVNASVRASLVNILCTTGGGGYFAPISGSGVFIDTRGIILTNAHVGQYLLLRDYPTPNNVDCVVRTGSPATAQYRARLLYLPPAWIDQNASQIKATEAMGTGENDYALLLVTSRTNGASLPPSFPALTLKLSPPSSGDHVIVAAYPAQYLGGATIQQNLYASSAVTTVQTLYTFSTTASPIDAVSISSSIVSQSGSSGGAVARAQDGALLGIIATETSGTTTADRLLRAITLGHIDRSLAKYGQGGLVNLLSGDAAAEADTFNTTVAPALTKKLIDVLK